jgi:ComF family protein
VLTGLWDVLFPPRCLGCGRRGDALCEECWAELPWLAPGVCGRCASTRAQRGACRGCRQLSPQLTSVRAVCAYQGAARKAVTTLKFRSGRYLAPLIGDLMRVELRRRPIRADVLVPIPIAPKRLRDRGYNQTELLAREVVEAVGARLATDLLRRVDRPAQQRLTAAERLSNLDDAIRCVAPEQVHGQRVLLLDDVCTTGATLSACAEVLVEAGAARVSALVFARDL